LPIVSQGDDPVVGGVTNITKFLIGSGQYLLGNVQQIEGDIEWTGYRKVLTELMVERRVKCADFKKKNVVIE